MRNLRNLSLLFILVGAIFSGRLLATDWLTIPAPYTHDPTTGMRTHQFQPVAASPAPAEAIAHSSGFRHFRSSLQVGRSSDHYHRTERWGEPVRPYGEWRFPYRPYSSPYPAWGPPFGGLNQFYGHPGIGLYGRNTLPGGGAAPHANFQTPPNFGYPAPYPALPDAGYAIPPYYDGGYPDLPYRPRLDDEQFYAKPEQD